MAHCDPDDLSLLALGEEVDVDQEHLRTCPQCAAELAALRTVVDAARSDDEVPEVTPPDQVWERIAAATGVAAPSPGTTVHLGSTGVATGVAVGGSGPRGHRARRWPTWLVAAAAALGLVAGAGATWVLTDRDEPGQELAGVELEALSGAGGQATARLVSVDDRLVLRISAEDLPPLTGSYYEAWLIDTDVVGMHTLGPVVEGTLDLPVPQGLDVEQFPVVDISVEPLDGDPTHSGDSVLRGVLDL